MRNKMQDNENTIQDVPETQPEVQKAKTQNWTRRYYFVLDDTNEVFKENLKSEKECRDAIRLDGEYDIQYFIGYTVNSLQPITKKARIVLN